MRWITRLLTVLWRFFRAGWIDVGGGMRPGSGASTLYVFLFLVFFLAGAALALLGVDLADADHWIDRQASWLDALASVALRMVFAAVLALCAATVAGGVYQRLPGRGGGRHPGSGEAARRRSGDAASDGWIGWGLMAVALVVGYFAAIGAFGRY